MCNKVLTQFYLPPAHEPYLSTFPPQVIIALWLVLVVLTHEEMARLS